MELTSDLDFTAVMAVIEQDISVITRIRDVVQSLGLKLSVTRSAEEAIAYMRGLGVYSNRSKYPLPRLILLDTGNQGFSDLTLLSWLREDSRFSKIPVGLLASVPQHKMNVSCAIDSACFVVQRHSLEELSTVLWETFCPHYPSDTQMSERPR